MSGARLAPPAQLRTIQPSAEEQLQRLVQAEVKRQLAEAVHHDLGYHKAAWRFGIGGLLIGALAISLIAGSLVFAGSLASTTATSQALAVERMQQSNADLREH